MIAEDVAAVVAARVSAALPDRTVYCYGTPSGSLPGEYVVVSANAGETRSRNLSGGADQRVVAVEVRTVATDADRHHASRRALWLARKCVDAVTDWRPSISGCTWLPEHLSSYGPIADTDTPDITSMCVERWTLAYH